MFMPTHRHADGGFYQHMGPQKGKSSDFDGSVSGWVDGHAYRNEEGMLFWTDDDRWAYRFEEIETDQQDLLVWDDENNNVAYFRFNTVEAGDVFHMLVTAGPPPRSNISPEFLEWMRRVLTAQAEMIAKKLHIRDHDFPDLIGDVAAFHAKFGQEYTGKPRILPDDLFDFRVKFHDEETTEYRDEHEKLKDAIARCDRRDIVNSLELQLDALIDAAWVVLGTADLQFGRKAFIEGWKRVAKANGLKVLGTDDPDAADSGREIKYDIRKPKGWEAPDHRDLVIDNAIFDVIFAESPPPEVETNTFSQDAGSYSDTRSV